MKIEVPLEIGDVIWVISEREAYPRTINGLRHKKWNGKINTEYELEKYGNIDINREYFLSEKDAVIEIAKNILNGLKDED